MKTMVDSVKIPIGAFVRSRGLRGNAFLPLKYVNSAFPPVEMGTCRKLTSDVYYISHIK